MKNLPAFARVLLHALNLEAFCVMIFYNAGAGRYVPEDQLSGLLLALAVLLHVPGLILSSVVALPLSMLHAEYVASWLWVVNVAICNTVVIAWVINVLTAGSVGHRAVVVR